MKKKEIEQSETFSKNKSVKVSLGIIIVYGAICFLVIAVFLFAQCNEYNKVEVIDPQSFQEQHVLKYGMDGILVNDSEILVNGWAVFPEENILTVDTRVVLESESGEFFLVPTQYVERQDIVDYMGNKELGYQKSGFLANVPKKMLDNSKKYTIHILYRNNEHNCLFKTDYVAE